MKKRPPARTDLIGKEIVLYRAAAGGVWIEQQAYAGTLPELGLGVHTQNVAGRKNICPLERRDDDNPYRSPSGD